jgi:enoyl-CoA hydratase/carnithine racemase
LQDWASSPGADERLSPYSDEPSLLFDATGPAPAQDQERVAAWLRQLPCPTLGIATGADTPITRACDLVVANADEAGPLTESIRRNPIAASVLVQTLRLTENLPVMAALDVESLAYATLQGGAEFRRWLAANKAEKPAMPTDAGPAVIIEREGDTLSLQLNRASNRNAINVEMRDALGEALQLVLADDSIRSVRLGGRGRCFSVGGDLTEFGTLPDPAGAHAIRSLTMPGRFLAQCAERVEAHVHGACIGSGVELPAFCRRVTVAKDTFFHMPELQFGLLPGGGGCVSIPRRIGRQRTAWWVLSGKRINAQKALEWGLVDEIADPPSPYRTK